MVAEAPEPAVVENIKKQIEVAKDLVVPDLSYFHKTMNTVIEWAIPMGFRFLGALVILFIGLFIARKISNLVLRAARAARLDMTVSTSLSLGVRYLIVAITLIAILGYCGVEMTSVIAILGAAGLAVGLAIQGTLSNVAAGVMLLLLRPFNVGDFVQVGAGLSGTVQAIDLFNVKLFTADNLVVTIPNSNVWGNAITNYSHNPTRVVSTTVILSNEVGIQAVFDAFQKVLDSDNRFIEGTKSVFIDALGEKTISVTAKGSVKTPEHWATVSNLRQELRKTIEKNDFPMPIPLPEATT